MNEHDGTESRSCDFCMIAEGLASAEIIHETNLCLAFFPLKPATKGHTLVIPKRHTRDFLSAGPKVFATLSSTAVEVGQILKSVYGAEGINMITSSGEAASQSIMHLHVHLVPRWTCDAVGDIWPPSSPTRADLLSSWAEEFRTFASRTK
ncbi:HIT domain-containing protein [Streptomyces rubiginosohelvolus]|uniref:HIT family protein n=1 Tax=Streptomyces rubiginosohelvolus TaxID=67362 RepID=UPI0033B7EA51